MAAELADAVGGEPEEDGAPEAGRGAARGGRGRYGSTGAVMGTGGAAPAGAGGTTAAPVAAGGGAGEDEGVLADAPSAALAPPSVTPASPWLGGCVAGGL